MKFYKCELEAPATCKNRVWIYSSDKAICNETSPGSCVYCELLIAIDVGVEND